MDTVKQWKYEQDEINNLVDEIAQVKIRTQKITAAIKSSKNVHRWSYKLVFESDSPASQNDWNHTLLTKINEANKGFGGTDIITSTEVGSILSGLLYFMPFKEIRSSTFYAIGILGNNFTVYVDVFIPAQYLVIIKSDFFEVENPECVVIIIDNLPHFSELKSIVENEY